MEEINTSQSSAILYLVATPIGNLADISKRAIDTLKSVQLILCEDTRQSKKLLDFYQIKTKVSSLHAHNEKKQSERAVNLLKSGQNIAIISDAGTPLINDPGAVLVNLAHQNKIRVSPIAGACAISALLSASGMVGSFSFWGFVPHKTNQSKLFLEKILNHSFHSLFFVGSSRIVKTVEQIYQINPNQTLVLGKEMSKIYETIYKSSSCNILNWLLEDENHQKGEFVLAVEKNHNKDSYFELNQKKTKLKKYLKILMNENISASQSAKIASKMIGSAKNIAYPISLEIAKQKIKK